MWLIPSDGSRCAQELAASTSASPEQREIWASTLARSATWSGKRRPLRFWLRLWSEATWMPRLFGLATWSDSQTCPANATPFMRDSRARRFQPLRADDGSLSTSGRQSRTWLPGFGPVSCSSRTSSDPLSCELPKTFTQWDTEEALPECPPPRWVPRIEGRDGGYLPTLTTRSNALSPSMSKWPAYQRLRELTNGQMPSIRWWSWFMGYPLEWLELPSATPSSPPKPPPPSPTCGEE